MDPDLSDPAPRPAAAAAPQGDPVRRPEAGAAPDAPDEGGAAEAAPAGGAPSPAVGEAGSIGGDASPGAGEATPDAGGPTLGAGDTGQIGGGANPAAGEANSVAAEAGPAAGDGSAGMLLLGAELSPRPLAPPAEPVGPPCQECPGGHYDSDGYCAQCGAKAPDPRDHVELAPATWVAGVCDRGIRHPSNEDALALAAAEDAPRRASLVVCDGVSTAQRSAEASQAAADSALAVLDSARSRGIGGAPSALGAALGNRLDVAASAAVDAVREVTERLGESVDDGFHISNPACTFVAAVIDGDTAVVGSVGDSRAYWVPDVGATRRLTTDDSWAEEQVRLGAPREVAESGPQAHTITRWIGVDTPDHVPAKTTLTLLEAGWLVLCSDGLWNYCSDEEAFAAVVRTALAAAGEAPSSLATELVAWANAQGGRDNITVALARIDPARHRVDDAPHTDAAVGDAHPASADTTDPSAHHDTGPGGIDG